MIIDYTLVSKQELLWEHVVVTLKSHTLREIWDQSIWDCQDYLMESKNNEQTKVIKFFI